MNTLTKVMNVLWSVIRNLPFAVVLCSIFLLATLMNHPSPNIIEFCLNPITMIVIISSTVICFMQVFTRL